MLFATRAEEQAAMGLAAHALRDIDRADRALAQAGTPEIGYYDHWSELGCRAGTRACSSICTSLLRPSEFLSKPEDLEDT
jgi:hypothetical protein